MPSRTPLSQTLAGFWITHQTSWAQPRQDQLTQTLIMCLLKTHNKASCPPSLPEYLPQFSVLKTNFSTLLTTRRRRILGPGMWTEETSATEKTTTKSRTTMRRTQTALSGKRFGLLFYLFLNPKVQFSNLTDFFVFSSCSPEAR